MVGNNIPGPYNDGESSHVGGQDRERETGVRWEIGRVYGRTKPSREVACPTIAQLLQNIG